MKKIKHKHNNNTVNLKESKKYIYFGVAFCVLLLAVGIVLSYVLAD